MYSAFICLHSLIIKNTMLMLALGGRKLVFCNIFMFVVWLSFILVSPETNTSSLSDSNKCSELMMGQYMCSDVDIDQETQQAVGCDRNTKLANVLCELAPGVTCAEQFNKTHVLKHFPCKWTNGHSFEKALLLSVFLGMFGVDRFYLGYPAIGLVKFATLGFMFLGQLVDILLIATQVVKPSDGSEYVIDYYGAASERIVRDNFTYIKPPD